MSPVKLFLPKFAHQICQLGEKCNNWYGYRGFDHPRPLLCWKTYLVNYPKKRILNFYVKSKIKHICDDFDSSSSETNRGEFVLRLNEPAQIAINAAGDFLINPHVLGNFEPGDKTFGSIFLFPKSDFSTDETEANPARISSLTHLTENITRAATSGLGAIDFCENGRASTESESRFFAILPGITYSVFQNSIVFLK